MSFQNWLIRLAKTNVLFPHKYIKKISIHALRGEGDSKNAQILFTVFL